LNLLTDNWWTRALNDLIAPFSNRVNVRYVGRRRMPRPDVLNLDAGVELRFGRRSKTFCTSSITIGNDGLESFTYSHGKTNLTARCEH
jgi:hypothetical protein